MPKFSDDPSIQSRFDGLNARLKTQLKKMPPLEKIHDANSPNAVSYAPYDLRAYAFLEEYKKDLDVDRCLKMLGIPKSLHNQWLAEAKFTDILNRIHKAYEDAILADGKTIVGWSVEIMRDLHNAFKDGDSKAANALSAMAGNMLRATGSFKDNQAKTPQVLIQINTSGQTTPATSEPKVVNPKPTEAKVEVGDININVK